jgi:DNA-binding transcriptional LysR family regulator
VLTDQAAEPRGTLKLTATPAVSRSAEFANLLAAYRTACPQVSVTVLLTGRSVDLVEEGFDVAVRPGPPAGVGRDGLMQRKLASHELHLYASPEYLRVHGAPGSLDELADHEFIGHSIATAADRLAARAPAWLAIAQLDLAVVVNDFDLVAELLIAGAGVGIAPSLTGERHVEAGRLQRIIPDASFGGSALWLLWPESRFTSVRVRRFIDLAAEAFA